MNLTNGLTLSKSSAFSLMEMTIVLAIMGILAAVVAPLALDKIDASKKTKASHDVTTLQNAITAFTSDTMRSPVHTISTNSDPQCGLLSGTVCNDVLDSNNSGASPKYLGSVWPSTFTGSNATSPLNNHLIQNGTGATRFYNAGWKGPYLDRDPTDPWGNRYLIFVVGLYDPNCGAWVISGGRDGDVTTNRVLMVGTTIQATGSVLQGDDVGIRM